METQLFNKTETSGRFSTYLALGSFGGGTLLLLLYLLFPNRDGLLILGFFYVLTAILLNSIAFLNLLYRYCIYPEDREILLIKMLLLLVNIPITVLYIYIVIHQNY